MAPVPTATTLPSGAARDGWQPDRDEALRLLRDELAGREYAEAEPHPVLEWLGEVLGGLLEWFGTLGGGVPAFPGWVLLVIVVLLALAVLLVVRPRTNASRRVRRSATVLADRSLGPEDHRRAASAATAAGDHDAALASWFRAVVRQAEVRTVLDERPGRTATEAAHALAAAFPAEHGALHRAAAGFNAVVYGKRPATADQAESVRLLDARLTAASAVPAPAIRTDAASRTPVAPR